MGASESRCCTGTPEKGAAKDGNVEKEFGEGFKATRVLQFDPRSPSQSIDRTPIEIMATPVQSKPLMRVQPMVENTMRKRHVGNTTSIVNSASFGLDPRSPALHGTRTPITSNLLGLQEGQQENKTLVTANVLDPRSPSTGIVRTPLLVEEEVFHCESTAGDKEALVICETPKKHHENFEPGATNPSFSPDDGLTDPRSPTQGIERTPVAKTDKPDHQAEGACARNLNDPRSPTTEVSRTPMGALFSGHRELRRTVLMTNALMASPATKKVSRVNVETPKEETRDTMEAADELDEITQDEIPAILRCNFDLNNSCSSSMVASIGSEVDCISLDESLEDDQTSLNAICTIEIDLMEQDFRKGDGEVEPTLDERQQINDELQPSSAENAAVYEPSKISPLPDLLPSVVSLDQQRQANSTGQIQQEHEESMEHLEGVKMPEIKPQRHAEQTEIVRTDDGAACGPSRDLEENLSPLEKDSTQEDNCTAPAVNTMQATSNNRIDGDLADIPESIQTDKQQNEEYDVGITKAPIYETIHSTKSENLQISEILGDMVSMAIAAEESEITDCTESEAKSWIVEEVDALNSMELFPDSQSGMFQEDEDVFVDSIEHKTLGVEREIIDMRKKSGDSPICPTNDIVEKIQEKTESDKGQDFPERITSESKDESQSTEAQKDNDENPAEAAIESAFHKNEKLLARDKKPQRKIRPPSTVRHRKKNVGVAPAQRDGGSSSFSQVNRSAHEQKANFVRKSKSASDDTRTHMTNKTIKKKPMRKSESKLMTPTAVRSPLAVLTNDAKTKVDVSTQLGASPAKTSTKLPRYQGTPPTVGTRTLSVSFSGRSSSRSQSVDRKRSGQRSFTYGKEN